MKNILDNYVQDVMSSRKKQLRWLGPHYNAVTSIKNTLKYGETTEMYNVNPRPFHSIFFTLLKSFSI